VHSNNSLFTLNPNNKHTKLISKFLDDRICWNTTRSRRIHVGWPMSAYISNDTVTRRISPHNSTSLHLMSTEWCYEGTT